MGRVLMVDGGPGDTPALTKLQPVALPAFGCIGTGRAARERLQELLEIDGNTLKGVHCLQPSMTGFLP